MSGRRVTGEGFTVPGDDDPSTVIGGAVRHRAPGVGASAMPGYLREALEALRAEVGASAEPVASPSPPGRNGLHVI